MSKTIEALGCIVSQNTVILAKCRCCGRLCSGKLTLAKVWLNGIENILVGVFAAGRAHQIANIEIAKIVTSITTELENPATNDSR